MVSYRLALELRKRREEHVASVVLAYAQLLSPAFLHKVIDSQASVKNWRHYQILAGEH